MDQQLSRLSIPWSFFDAHELPSPSLNLCSGRWIRTNGRMLTAAELGCYSSHYSLLATHAARPDEEVLIVLEDDALVDCDYLGDQTEVLRLVKQYGYIRLNAQMAAPPEEVEILGRRRLVRFKKKVHGTAGYAVTARTARIFVEHLCNVLRPIDVEMDRFWDHKIPILCFYQFVVIERSAQTQIADRSRAKLSTSDFLVWKMCNQIEKLRCLFMNLRFSITGRGFRNPHPAVGSKGGIR